ncbi:MAG: NAD(P)H-dependent oxidoreductase [Sulfuricurvum sp.]|uniref:NAD(P)H-dependent oxidoreductase n=1 Tax=Sulfuricurvum sp. TaxID=2025608 RepID=UPI00262A1B75|nr:NAD(P)H-dependent oxidoreductase [Sulfuricurvum sp.]MDD2785045.1 NAD(P)H-dependent oxidoreductase [Sulfuricurvum sp.]
MKNVLLLNLHQKYEGFANGNLTRDLINEARSFFTSQGYAVRESAIDEGYDVAEELEKFQWADVFFVQSPVYWMGLPWLAKKYGDEVFSGGNGTVTFVNDGRSNGGNYGSGGLMKGKRYMLSFTYNCPTSEFNNTNGFFEGMSVDQANIALHKLFQFCGAEPLKSYSVHDVYKPEFKFDEALKGLQKMLAENFPS